MTESAPSCPQTPHLCFYHSHVDSIVCVGAIHPAHHLVTQGVVDTAVNPQYEDAIDATTFPEAGTEVMKQIYTKTFPALQKSLSGMHPDIWGWINEWAYGQVREMSSLKCPVGGRSEGVNRFRAVQREIGGSSQGSPQIHCSSCDARDVVCAVGVLIKCEIKICIYVYMPCLWAQLRG